MNSGTHIVLVTTLGMILTFIFYLILNNTRINDFLFENLLIDQTRDQLLYVRCWWNNEKLNRTCEYLFSNVDKYNLPVLHPIIVIHMSQFAFFGLEKRNMYIRPVISTIIFSWCLARVLNRIDFSYEIDAITVYFFIWQIIFLITKWEFQQLPIYSCTIIRGWLCVIMACGAFTIYDTIFKYLSKQISFIFFWMFSLTDIFLCLHPNGRLYKQNPVATVSKTNFQIPVGVYSTWYLDENEEDEERTIGDGDFYFYNLMLLTILPSLSSIITKTFITIGYIVIVQIAYQITFQLGLLYNQDTMPGIPIPIALVSLYGILLDIFIQY